ncbi:phiSA1p31-related protein [Streptomyces sp. B27]|uniref:phiSA1p31-related protein n=1 Tax=Streptomyces sp. B27 TaxID=2485015 RepID=UPI000FD97EBB|nr:phiSA1p31-related protein [Streptomyces sp. B27]
MTTYLHDGVVFDLTRAFVDVVGVEWEWRGEWTPTGEPLLVSPGLPESPVPLPDVYRDHGPLITVSPRPTAAQYRAAVDPDYADTVAAGYIETPAAFGARITPAVTPPPVLTAHHLNPSPMEQSGFRRFLNSIAGGNR